MTEQKDMKKILHVNAHQPYSFSQGKLNHSLTEMAISRLEEKGYDVVEQQSNQN